MRRGEEERRAVERQSLEELRRGVEEESCGGVEEVFLEPCGEQKHR